MKQPKFILAVLCLMHKLQTTVIPDQLEFQDQDIDQLIFSSQQYQEDSQNIYFGEEYQQSDINEGSANDQGDLIDGPGLIIETHLGKIRGKIQSPYSGVRQFLGIPYAKPPVDNLRWAPPQDHDGWNHIRDATQLGAQCPQLNPLERQSEDCLFIDVYTPTQDDQQMGLLPVMMWIHGGAYIFGSGNMVGIQDPTYIVHHKKVVIVSINYRLGPLGFLVTKDLKGNFGLLDQRLAMQWVHKNIHAFGGDKGKITLWGESAGAMSITHHLTMRKSFGLFHQAILQSPIMGVRCRTLKEAEKIGDIYAKRIGCNPNDLDCMRKVPLWRLAFLKLPTGLFNQDRFFADLLLWSPVIDGEEVVGQPFEMMLQNQSYKIPMIIGSNKNEAGFVTAIFDTLFSGLIGRTGRQFVGKVYAKLLNQLFKNASSEVMQLYPSVPTEPLRNIDNLVDAVSDYMAVCPITKVSEFLSAQNEIFMYSFEFTAKFLPPWFMRGCKKKNVCHAMELPYVFHSLQHRKYIPKFSKEEHTMSHILVDYWTSFATDGFESESSLSSKNFLRHDFGEDSELSLSKPKWPKFLNNDQRLPKSFAYMEFSDDATANVRQGPLRGEYCKLWHKLKFDY